MVEYKTRGWIPTTLNKAVTNKQKCCKTSSLQFRKPLMYWNGPYNIYLSTYRIFTLAYYQVIMHAKQPQYKMVSLPFHEFSPQWVCINLHPLNKAKQKTNIRTEGCTRLDMAFTSDLTAGSITHAAWLREESSHSAKGRVKFSNRKRPGICFGYPRLLV